MPRFKRLLSPFVAVLALVAMPVRADDDPPPPPEPRTLEQYQAEAEKLLGKHGVPGAGIALVEDGEVAWVGGLGLADKASGRKVDADTHFRIGSITKVFAAIAVMQLVEQGRLALDAEVATIAPELPITNPWAESDPIRVVHLLEHTAGFDDMHFSRFLKDGDRPLVDDMRAFAPEMTVRWRPGQFMSYSNVGYGAVAYVVEKASGERYRDYVKSHVWAPLGMTATVWDDERARVAATLASGYGDGGEPETFEEIKLYPAGAVISTAGDLAKLATFLISRGAGTPGVLSAGSIERMERQASTASARAGLRMGYGLANMRYERGRVMLQGHDGGVTGFLSSMYYSPEHRFAFVFLINALESQAYRGLREISTNYLARGIARPQPGDLDGDAQADPAHDGWYYANNPRNEILAGVERMLNSGYLAAQGNRYVLTQPVLRQSERYFAMPNGQVRQDKQAHASGVFTTDLDGRAMMTSRDDVYTRGSWWNVALPLYLLTAAMLLMASTVLFAPVWLVRMAFGRLRDVPHRWTRALPLLATLVFVGTAAVSTTLSIPELSTVNPKTVAIAAGGALFGLLALLSVWRATRTFGGVRSRVLAWHTLLASVACLGFAGWLWHVKLLGLRMWAY